MWAAAAGPKGMSIWKDGKKLGSQTTNPGTRTANAVSTMINGGGNFCIGADSCEFYFVYGVNYQWSDDQIRSWFAAPFSMMYPSYDQLENAPLISKVASAGGGNAGTGPGGGQGKGHKGAGGVNVIYPSGASLINTNLGITLNKEMK